MTVCPLCKLSCSRVILCRSPSRSTAFRMLHECFGSVLGAMGPKFFLMLLPLNLEAQDPSGVNSWLFPILKQYTVGASLSFFRKSILSEVGEIKKHPQMVELEGRIYSSRGSESSLVYLSLWSLFPAFCNYPIDTASSLKDLKKELCDSLRTEPDNKTLLEENNANAIVNDEMSIPVQRARANYTPQVATKNLDSLKSAAHEFLTTLFAVFMESENDNGGCLQSAIGEFASISDKEVVSGVFEHTMKELLKVTEKAVKAEQPNFAKLVLERTHLLDLAGSLLPGLNAKQVDVLLFSAIKPALQDDQGSIQKKAYKILSYILKDPHELRCNHMDELLGMMVEVLPCCHFSAKRDRLECLYLIIVHVFKEDAASEEDNKQDMIGCFVSEIILAFKGSRRTRDRAYDIIVQIGHAFGGKSEKLLQLFNMVAGDMMSAEAVKCLGRLAYEFSDLVSAAYNVLPSAFLLLQRKNKQVIKANLGLVEVLVTKSQVEYLKIHLRSLVEGLLRCQEDDSKRNFNAWVKVLVEMLVKKCGHDAVKAVMLEQHMKLLNNISQTCSGDSPDIQAKSTSRVLSDFDDDEEMVIQRGSPKNADPEADSKRRKTE